MPPAVDGRFLADIAVFGGLRDDVRDRIAGWVREVRFDGPSPVVAEGDLAREMFIVREGELEVCKHVAARPLADGWGSGGKAPGNSAGEPIRLAVLRAGDCMGEMSLIDIQPRSASVRTLGPASLLVLANADLAQLFRTDPESYTLLVLNIAREISRRLRRADELLAEMMRAAQALWSRNQTRAVTRPGKVVPAKRRRRRA